MSTGTRESTAWLDVTTLYASRGRSRHEAPVTQEQHALQCASLAETDGADDELVLAALLHDIGRLLPVATRADRGEDSLGGDVPRDHHSRLGAGLLRPWLPERTVWLVEYHVVAKRYLCATDARYAAAVSAVSPRSGAAAPGEPLSRDERRRLEAHPWFADLLRLRRWDDGARRPGVRVPGFGSYASLLHRHLALRAVIR